MDPTQPATTASAQGNSVPGQQNGNAANDVEDAWDEERIEQALETLKEMHIQVCLHRNTF